MEWYKPYTVKVRGKIFKNYQLVFEETPLNIFFTYSKDAQWMAEKMNSAWNLGYQSGIAVAESQDRYKKFKLLLEFRNNLKKALETHK